MSIWWNAFTYGTTFFSGIATSSWLRNKGEETNLVKPKNNNIIVIDTTHKDAKSKSILHYIADDDSDEEDYIRSKTYKKFIHDYRKVDQTDDLHVVVSTLGGQLSSSLGIARVLYQHQGKVYVYIPKYACSGGTLISLMADQIYMDPYAFLSPIDPQLSMPWFTFSLKNLRRAINETEETGALHNYMNKEADDIIRGYKNKFDQMLLSKYNKKTIKKIDSELFENQVDHSCVMYSEELDYLNVKIMEATQMKKLLFTSKRKLDQEEESDDASIRCENENESESESESDYQMDQLQEQVGHVSKRARLK